MERIIQRDCECWRETISLNLIDRGLPVEALRHVYCPQCSPGIRRNWASMVEKNGWVIEYNVGSLKPTHGTVCLIQHRGKAGFFQIYVERGNLMRRQNLKT